MILPEIFRVVSRFPRYISCYTAENQLPLGQCTVYTSFSFWSGHCGSPNTFVRALTQKVKVIHIYSMWGAADF